MKSIQSYILPLLVFAGAAGGVNAESLATNINPALTYFQAFIVAPDFSSEDRDYLFTNEWRGQPPTERFGHLLNQYDNEFRLIRAGSQSAAPCEWGIDWSAGPDTLLAYLPRIKASANVARLRALWHLQNGRESDARDDLLAALTLARNGANGSLIGTLVQIAVERIVCETIAENFNHLSPEVLQQLADGLNAPPPRKTIADCIPAEQNLCEHWMIDRALELQAQNPGNDLKVLQGLHHLFEDFLADTSNNDGPKDDKVTATAAIQIMAAAGGTSDGVIRLLREMDPVYAKLAAIEALPFDQYEGQMTPFEEELKNSTNPFVRTFVPAVVKCRPREFAALADIAMVQAAVQYKLHGEAGLKSMSNPCGQGPFAMQRFVFDGVDRGFELDAAYNGMIYPKEVFIFVEKDGPPFLVFGKRAGEAPQP